MYMPGTNATSAFQNRPEAIVRQGTDGRLKATGCKVEHGYVAGETKKQGNSNLLKHLRVVTLSLHKASSGRRKKL